MNTAASIADPDEIALPHPQGVAGKAILPSTVLSLQEQAGEYRLLSRLLARPPDRDLLADAATLGLLDAGWEEQVEQIQVEFTRLFSAPGSDAIHVHQSVYTDTLRVEPAQAGSLICGASFDGGEFTGYLGGTSCQEARRWYAASGFDPPSHEMPDHVSIQLDFVAHLLLAEAHCADDAEAWRERREQFCARFLKRWLCVFAGKVAANPVSEFYRRVGRQLAGLDQANTY